MLTWSRPHPTGFKPVTLRFRRPMGAVHNGNRNHDLAQPANPVAQHLPTDCRWSDPDLALVSLQQNGCSKRCQEPIADELGRERFPTCQM